MVHDLFKGMTTYFRNGRALEQVSLRALVLKGTKRLRQYSDFLKILTEIFGWVVLGEGIILTNKWFYI